MAAKTVAHIVWVAKDYIVIEQLGGPNCPPLGRDPQKASTLACPVPVRPPGARPKASEDAGAGS